MGGAASAALMQSPAHQLPLPMERLEASASDREGEGCTVGNRECWLGSAKPPKPDQTALPGSTCEHHALCTWCRYYTASSLGHAGGWHMSPKC